jgi:hypothetical protein
LKLRVQGIFGTLKNYFPSHTPFHILRIKFLYFLLYINYFKDKFLLFFYTQNILDFNSCFFPSNIPIITLSKMNFQDNNINQDKFHNFLRLLLQNNFNFGKKYIFCLFNQKILHVNSHILLKKNLFCLNYKSH